MITTSYAKPNKFEFRITKTDCKKAFKSILSGSFSLTKPFQEVLNELYNSFKFNYVQRYFEEDVCVDLMLEYSILGVDVVFHKTSVGRGSPVYSSMYQNTTSEDFNYMLMNTFLPLLEYKGLLVKDYSK